MQASVAWAQTMNSLALILGCGIINRLRGWGPENNVLRLLTSKVFSTPFIFGTLVWLYSRDLSVGLIAGLGYQLYCIPGWGDYFDFSVKNNKEVKIIDTIVSKFLLSGSINDMVSMSLRAFIFGYPAFIALSLYFNSTVPVLSGLLLLLQGPIYYAMHKLFMYYTEKAEVLCGVLWGLALCLALQS